MTNLGYLQGRKKYGRPQAMLWANNPGTTQVDPETDEVYHVPLGKEINSNAHLSNNSQEFLIISDHNRAEIDFGIERIETRQRMVNGRMRSFHVADKLTISTAWDMLPSRSYYSYPSFNSSGISPYSDNDQKFTVDGGAGGADMLDWYERYTGSFWLYLSYDKRQNFRDLEDENEEYGNLGKYSQVIEVFFSDFSYSVVKRGANNFDFWNISLGLEEV